jgi:hypothetical protein
VSEVDVCQLSFTRRTTPRRDEKTKGAPARGALPDLELCSIGRARRFVVMAGWQLLQWEEVTNDF